MTTTPTGKPKSSPGVLYPVLRSHSAVSSSTTQDEIENDSVVSSSSSSSPSLSQSSSPAWSSSLTLRDSSSTLRLLQAMEDLYPSEGLSQRIATSRTDGYWPFIRDGHDPPSEFVYGEFDLSFLFDVLEMSMIAIQEWKKSSDPLPSDNYTFTDLGSGTGRLVMGAAGFYPWKLCRGIELLPGIHRQAVSKLESCLDGRCDEGDQRETRLRDRTSRNEIEHAKFVPTESGLWLASSSSSKNDEGQDTVDNYHPQSANADDDDKVEEEKPKSYSMGYRGNDDEEERISLAPIEFHCGSFTDPYQFFGDSNIVFCFSSCLPPTTRIELAKAIGRQCQSGTIVITTEYQLPAGGTIEPNLEDPSLPHGEYALELLYTVTGTNESTGGLSTVYIHRLTTSVGDGIPRTPPILSISERAYRAIKEVEETNDTTAFVRRVVNDMVFAGFPNSWIPKLR